MDRSDGPASYGEATHVIALGIQLGDELDGNVSSVISADASGDDLDVIDDEDGVTFPSLTQGQSATIDVAVTGAGGYLQAWIDWDGDDKLYRRQRPDRDRPPRTMVRMATQPLATA